MEDEALRTEVALFRFGVISELVASRLEPGELTELIYQKSEQHWHIPGSHRTRVSAATVRRWLRLYERGGRELSALMPARRCDRGCSRTVDDETRGALIRLRKERQRCKTQLLG
jgi:putative transposase